MVFPDRGVQKLGQFLLIPDDFCACVQVRSRNIRCSQCIAGLHQYQLVVHTVYAENDRFPHGRIGPPVCVQNLVFCDRRVKTPRFGAGFVGKPAVEEIAVIFRLVRNNCGLAGLHELRRRLAAASGVEDNCIPKAHAGKRFAAARDLAGFVRRVRLQRNGAAAKRQRLRLLLESGRERQFGLRLLLGGYADCAVFQSGGKARRFAGDGHAVGRDLAAVIRGGQRLRSGGVGLCRQRSGAAQRDGSRSGRRERMEEAVCIIVI